MAKFSMQAPQINTEELNDKEAIRRVQSYLYKLNEQLRYMMMNLDGENIQEGSIGETQLSRPVRQNISNIEIKLGTQEQKSKTLADNFGNYYTKIETAAQITTMMDDALGNYYTKSETAAEISTMMGDALGNYYTKTETAAEINTLMTNALGDYSTSRETADAIALYVGNNAYGKVSGIGINANGISMTGSQYIQMASGYISIGEGFTAGAGRTQILALDVFSSRENGYIDVTGLLEDLDWYGWIRNASVSGDTLTLTKSNGRTVTFTPSGGGGSGFTPSYGLQQLNNILNDATWSTTSGKLTLYLSGNYTVSLAAGYHDAD